MKTVMKVFATLLLSATVQFAFAQRGGGGIHSFGHAGHNSAAADSQKDFALRTTATQREAFVYSMAATEAARDTGRSMGDNTYWNSWHNRHVGYDLDAGYRNEHQLQSALTGMATSHQEFLQVLSQDQHTELGSNLSRLEQLQGDLNSQMSQLNYALMAVRPDSFHVSTRLYGIEKSIDKWRSELRKIAKEMNIPK